MPTKITWSLNVQVQDGPKISMPPQDLPVDAYDRIDVVIPSGADAEDVDVQPGEANQVKFLAIKADKYGPGLTYSVNDAAEDQAQRVVLDALHVFIGAGAVALLKAAPKKLFFYNDLDSNVTISILVGRAATTPPPQDQPAGGGPASGGSSSGSSATGSGESARGGPTSGGGSSGSSATGSGESAGSGPPTDGMEQPAPADEEPGG